ncbi:imm11 family protein [Photobacterium halotolerans]|uniref:Immunity MXAN-0049 protein domain-containing protein n=1 Tax=Photobacterium halotolerans TaxID=265726 RepID=A0A0F5V6R7_9GAMM|nr:DUF1629 domain-containing protein [Photobacterium halotolerans]KKC97823.1 hypothetical protein KY46_21825 [Photobacterium halotolerans]
MKYDRQYYLLTEDSQSALYMLSESEKSDDGLLKLLSMRSIKRKVLGPGYMHITMGDDGNFKPCDYHEVLPSGLVSDKFKQVLESFQLPGVDFYPTYIENRGRTWDAHYLLHVWQNHRALHPKRSVYDGTYENDRFQLEKMCLNEDVLDKVPLNERLVFRLNEKPHYLYHESVVVALKAAGLTGVGFLNVQDWGPNSAFI